MPENRRGICTSCGLVNDGTHVCSPEQVRLMEIDREAGPRPVREELLSLGRKGFNNKIEALENEASQLRAKLNG